MGTHEDNDAHDQSDEPEVGGPKGDDELEFEEAVSELEQAESQRQRIGYVIAVAVTALAAVTVVIAFQYRSWLFHKMPVEETARETVKESDDPQCRDMIAEVTNIGNTFFALEADIEEHVPGEDLEAIRTIDQKLAKIEKRLDEAESLSREATLQFDKSREELDTWFAYADGELRVLRDVTSNQVERLENKQAAADDGGSDGDNEESDSGGASETDNENEESADGQETDAEGNEEATGSDRPPVERRDGALVALHDAFENFRVWHRATIHPCGAADEDETPWRPDDWDERKDEKKRKDGPDG